MKTTEVDAKRVTVLIGESDRYQGHSLHEAIVTMLHEEGVAGATAFKGLMGFGESSRVHTAHLLDLAEDLPVMVVFYDTEDVVDRVMPKLERMIGSGIVAVDDVRVTRFAKG